MATHRINLQEFLIKLFVVVDDFLLCFPKSIGKPTGRTPSLTESEIITLALFGIFAGFKTIAQIYAHIASYHRQDFPTLPQYKNFNALINRHALQAAQLLQMLMAFN